MSISNDSNQPQRPISESDIVDYLGFNPTDTTKQNNVDIKKTEKGISITFSQDVQGKGPLSKTLEIDMSRGKIYGIPSSPKEPKIPIPASGKSDGIAAGSINDWSVPSAMAYFSTLMSQLEQVMSKNRRMEASLAMTQNQNTLELGLSSAEDTKLSGQEKAREMTMQALGATFKSVIGVFSVVSSVKNQGLATQDPTVSDYQGQIDKLTAKKNGSPDLAGEGVELEDMSAPEVFTPEDQAQLDKLTNKKNEAYQQVVNQLNNNTRMYSEIANGVNDAISSSTRAAIEASIGNIEARKQVAQTQQSLEEKAASTNASRRDSEAQEIGKLLDMMMQLMNSEFKAQSMSG